MTVAKTPLLFKGAFFCLLGYLCIALVSVCAKALPAEIPTINVAFFQNFICFLLILPLNFHRGLRTLQTTKLMWHIVRALAGILSFFTLFLAIKQIPLVEALLLQTAAPIWLPLLLFICFRQKIVPTLWTGIIIGFIGIIFILKPGLDFLHSGTLIGVISGILLAVSFIAIGKLSATEPTARILFYYFSIGTLVLLPFAATHWTTLSLHAFLLLLGVGLFMYLAQMFITYAFTFAQARTLAPLSYSIVLFSGMFDWLFWHHIPDIFTWIGAILVILGGLITLYIEKKIASPQ